MKNEPAENRALVVQLTAQELRGIVEDAVKAAMRSAPNEDRLLTVAQVAAILNVKEDWIYHNIKKLPFVRKVGGMLRFSCEGLQRYIESTKFTITKGSLT
jgi:excisionase family DNA binding protein